MTDDIGTPFERMTAAMRDPDKLFTWEQMGYLIARERGWAYAAGFDAGYNARVAQENATYPPPPVEIVPALLVADGHRAARRAAADDRSQRWAGGTAQEALERFAWEADRPDPGFDSRPPWARR